MPLARRFDYSGRWFKGNIHMHTTVSDGAKDPTVAARAYADAGYDFIALTDHNVASDQASMGIRWPLLVLDGVEIHGSDHGGAGYHIVCLGRFPDLPVEAGLIPMLEYCRQADGILSLAHPALMYLSEKSNIPLSQLYAVARFYGAFSLKPRGENIIRVCLGTACHVKGGGTIADAISRELDIGNGETTKDGVFTLEHVHCLGACALAPIVTVNDKYHANVTIGKMMDIIRSQHKESTGRKTDAVLAEVG